MDISPEIVMAGAEIAAVIVAAFAILVTLRGIREQLWLNTFAEYTGRYSDIVEKLPYDARDPKGTFDLDRLPVSEREHILAAVRRYLNLCSEELYLHQKQRIDDETWFIWLTGIKDTMRMPCFSRA